MGLAPIFGKTRTVVDEKEIDKLLSTRKAVSRMLSPAADAITKDVKARTGRSSTLRPYGRKMSTEPIDGRLRVGTDWGPAVPVEYGTVRTRGERILLDAAEKNGRVDF